MTELSVKKSEKLYPNKRDIYREFILWTAMPYKEKERLGLETQEAFIAYYKIGANTPTRWKHRPDFEGRVDAILKMWSTDKTPDVVHSIYRSAVKGNPMSQMLWLQYFKKFNPKKEDTDEKKVVLGINDIRYAIEQLPENLKKKHYGYLRELTEDIAACRNARDIEDDVWYARPETTISDEADNDAQDIPNKESSNAVAKSHKASIRADMVGPISESNHQSAERWW